MYLHLHIQLNALLLLDGDQELPNAILFTLIISAFFLNFLFVTRYIYRKLIFTIAPERTSL